MLVIKLFQRTKSAKRTKAYDKEFMKILNFHITHISLDLVLVPKAQGKGDTRIDVL